MNELIEYSVTYLSFASFNALLWSEKYDILLLFRVIRIQFIKANSLLF